MAALLSTLNQLQARFAPFLARYQDFMQNDPQVAPAVRPASIHKNVTLILIVKDDFVKKLQICAQMHPMSRLGVL